MTNQPAGWYPDPNDVSTQRYWDGGEWLNIPAPTGSPASAPARAKMNKRTQIILWSSIAVVLLAAAGGVAWKVLADQNAAAVLAEEEAAEKQRVEDEADAAAEAEQALLEKQESEDDAERLVRKAMVSEIEGSIKTMAEGHVADGILTGPVISVDCSAVGGGSTDDLDQSTTVFGCFVANVDNGDGTLSGYNYKATMNWDTGQYTFGMGAP